VYFLVIILENVSEEFFSKRSHHIYSL